jgi:hypothetical protein
MRRSADLVFGINQLVLSLKRSASLDERAQMSTAKGAHRRFTFAAFDSFLLIAGGADRIGAMA